ncbi:OPT oligopeptide transporter [Cercophora newfieldiana]|uniref:OPT oligopeptide transporter n=1 Tax=Cercophora newfieldiana TaxID=92897 RepID=A0AA39YEC3_9PEZI|nr:OPT oligopeptide transporter [Cercophora newfieldiana]
MADVDEKKTGVSTVTSAPADGVFEASKGEYIPRDTESERAHDVVVESDLVVTEEDLLEAKAIAANLTLEETREMMLSVMRIHERDPNFPHTVLLRIREFLDNDAIYENPEKHADLIHEMKIEAALITNNSPYSEVRAVVENTDDPSMPCSTVRAWTIGLFFSFFLAFVNQLFSIRLPVISIEANVAQLLAFPIGKAWEKWMPNYEFSMFGHKHNLNPGPFNKKEHMLIAIMANTAKSLPYTQYIVWTQVLPQFFNQQYAKSFGYQFLIAMSTNFIGYGLAGLTRRFIVYPTYCVWPASLVTIALNSALHKDDAHNTAVRGPFNRTYGLTRYKFFLWAFGAMFIYFWFPNYLFEVLTFFSWMTWISPNNLNLEILTGFKNGLGLFNPWPTFDWNVMLYDGLDPLMVPAFSTINRALGMFMFGFVILGVWYTNTWNTGYLPINTNKVWDHYGNRYNVSRAINEKGMYDHEKYMNYSAAYLGAANAIVYGAFFAIYAAAVTHVFLFHRYEISVGFKNMWASIRRKKQENKEYKDVHNRLMSVYPEVSEWWYLATLLVAAGFGFAGVTAWPTYTTAGVVPYGVLLAIVFVIPIGVIKAMTGVEVTLNVLAEFIGGMWVEGNALAMNFFKSFGYVTCAHAVQFANDLKIAHYIKIPPWHCFAAQMVATLVSTIVCTGVISFQVNIPGVCTDKAPMRFLCPGPTTFFTASVLWGTIGPLKVFGHTGQYKELLLGFPAGIIVTVIVYFLMKKFPKNQYIRQFHPVAFWYGALNWAPYSFSYAWPSVPIAWLSWVYVRKRYLAFWSKYNFVLSAAFSSGIAIAGLIMLFSVQWAGIEVKWWGNTQAAVGCEDTACTLMTLDKEAGERFYPWWDSSKVPAP